MKEEPYIKILSFEDGSCQIEAFHFEGKACEAQTAFLRNDLLAPGAVRTKKPEYDQVVTQTAKSKPKIKL